MKVRVLWVSPHVKRLVPGKVYDLPAKVAEQMLSAREAEPAPAATEVAPYDPPPEEKPLRLKSQAARDAAAAHKAAEPAPAPKGGILHEGRRLFGAAAAAVARKRAQG